MSVFSQLQAAGHVQANGTALVIKGATVVRAAAGLYDVTLDQALDDTEMTCDVTYDGGTGTAAHVTSTSDLVKRVSTFNAAGAAADQLFFFKFSQIAYS